jgi:ankyrin repeat protein
MSASNEGAQAQMTSKQRRELINNIENICMNSESIEESKQIGKYLDQLGSEFKRVQVGRFSYTFLHVAAENGAIMAVEELLKRGAAVNVKNRHGDTALHLAATEGHSEVVEMLLKQGADGNLLNDIPDTPLDICENDKTKEILFRFGCQTRDQIIGRNSFLKSGAVADSPSRKENDHRISAQFGLSPR